MATTTRPEPMWEREPELMARLLAIQNTEKFWNHDIMTIVGFFTTREQLLAHIQRNGG